MQAARLLAWQRLSEGGRAQFGWPYRGTPSLADDDEVACLRERVGDSEPPPPFALLILEVEEVDYLPLRSRTRWLCACPPDGAECVLTFCQSEDLKGRTTAGT